MVIALKKIEEIDKNLLVNSNLKTEGIKIYDINNEPFKIYGVTYHSESGNYVRLDPEIAKTINDGVKGLNNHTAGGRVRFTTNSKYLGVRANFSSVEKMPHFTLAGSAGFDLYTDDSDKQKYLKSFIPQYCIKDTLESEVVLSGEERTYTINFPLYSSVKSLYILLDEDATLSAPTPYKHEKPVVFYGSSITQGGCASRPGNCYQGMLCSKYSFNYINLGFAGSARGEKEIAEYIAGLDMSIFVYDYDHNAPSIEHLRETHEPMFNIIREKHPNLPIICMCRPYPIRNERRQIIMNTVENAKAKGDKNVYFVDTAVKITEMGLAGSITVDACHPNDLGFYCMAKVLEEYFEKLL